MKSEIRSFFHNFLKCGLTGWCMEILFTALNSFRHRDMSLKGTTSVWMFPIYGSAAFLAPLMRLLREKPLLLRGTTYMGLIFSGEYLSGLLLDKFHVCPWDYSRSRFHIRHLIRLDFAPYWFGAGLLFEKLLTSASSKSDTLSKERSPQ